MCGVFYRHSATNEGSASVLEYSDGLCTVCNSARLQRVDAITDDSRKGPFNSNIVTRTLAAPNTCNDSIYSVTSSTVRRSDVAGVSFNCISKAYLFLELKRGVTVGTCLRRCRNGWRRILICIVKHFKKYFLI